MTANGTGWPSIDAIQRSRTHPSVSERALVGLLLCWPARVGEVSQEVSPEDIQDGPVRAVYSAMIDLWKRGVEPHPPVVADELQSNGTLERITGMNVSFLTTLQAESPVSRATGGLVRVIQDGALLRRLELTGKSIVALAADRSVEASAALDQAKELVGNIEAVGNVASEAEPLGMFCQGDDTYDWLVPGLIERGDRTLIVASESAGKSTLLRQIAVKCSFGLHPFSSQPVDPMRVLMVDLENPPNQGRRKMRPMLAQARRMRPYGDDAMMSVVCRPGGIDLTKRNDARWLAGQVMASKPDLLVIGPLYKMFSPDDRFEAGARTVTMVLDDLRTRMGFALIMETHAPQEYGGGKREMRPIGSSLWRRWPEFGLSFVVVDGHPSIVRITVWKPRDERQWPQFLERGGEWPWTPCRDPEGPKGRPIKEEPGFRPGFGQEPF